MAENKEKKYIVDNTVLMAEWDWAKNSEFGYDPKKNNIWFSDKCLVEM